MKKRYFNGFDAFHKDKIRQFVTIGSTEPKRIQTNLYNEYQKLKLKFNELIRLKLKMILKKSIQKMVI